MFKNVFCPDADDPLGGVPGFSNSPAPLGKSICHNQDILVRDIAVLARQAVNV